ncbi:carboxypeptidase-like regulatory domain-containing protein [Actinoplanes sp. CA-054009]
MEITNLQTEVLTGGQLNMQYSISAPEAETPGEGQPGGNAGRATVAYQVTGMSCSGDCSGVTQIDAGGDRGFNARLTAPNVDAGQTRQVQVRITASILGEASNATATITVKGPDKPQTVRQVSGKVRDQDGKGVSGAAVGLRDSAGTTFETTSGSGGSYSFTSTDSKPIAVGTLTLGALKQDYERVTITVQGNADGRVSKNIILEKTVVESPSASPSASASASASPTPTEEESAAEEQPATTETVEEGTPANNAAASEDSGSSWLYIIIGVLLVAAGIGAIVLVWMRRKNNPPDGPDDDPTSMSPSGGAVPPSQGRFNDATRVAAPVGGGRANDATMIAQAPGMADAPTMLQRPVPAAEDEFPDPYGAPVPPQGGYVGAGGWDNGQQGGTQQYGGGTQQYGGGTQQYGGGTQQYGGGTQQYGGQQADNDYGSYSEPTGFYRPEDDQGYGGYDQGGQQQQYGGQQQGGWDEHDNGGYDQGQPQQQGGWDDHDNRGYPPQQGGGQQYGGHTQQYNGGYDQDDYDQRGQRRY